MVIEVVLAALRATWIRFRSANGSTLAAAIAYRALFALAPLLLVAVAVAGAAFGDEAARGLLSDRVEGILGPDLAEAAEDLVAAAARSQGAGVLGAALLIWTGSGLFAEVQGALRVVFEVGPAATRGVRRALLGRLKTVVAVLLAGLVLTVLAAAATVAAWIPGASAPVGWAFSIVVLAAVLAGGFRYLTPARPSWKSTGIAAAVTLTAALAAAGAVGMMVARSRGDDPAGIGGGVVAVVFAVYVLANVLLLGAALTKVLSGPDRQPL